MALEGTIWIYCFFCGLATAVLIANRSRVSVLLSPVLAGSAISTTYEDDNNKGDKNAVYSAVYRGYPLAIALGWLTTALAAISYIVLTQKEAIGTYSIPDLALFTLLNGALEQFMFIGWFLLGCLLAKSLGAKASWQIFGLGFFIYSMYSGFIHALFWTTVWPAHLLNFIVIRVCFLTLMSISWMWLFWRYRAVGPIICMHMVIDFFTIGHLHFNWFDAYHLNSLMAYIQGF